MLFEENCFPCTWLILILTARKLAEEAERKRKEAEAERKRKEEEERRKRLLGLCSDAYRMIMDVAGKKSSFKVWN